MNEDTRLPGSIFKKSKVENTAMMQLTNEINVLDMKLQKAYTLCQILRRHTGEKVYHECNMRVYAKEKSQ